MCIRDSIYSASTSGRSIRQESPDQEFYARNPDTDGASVVYSAGADLHRIDVSTGEYAPIEVDLPSSRTERRRRFQAPGSHLESVSLHPEGHSLAVVARGGAFTMPLWEGAPRRHGPVSTVRHRRFTWMGDGERTVHVSDAGGDERLVVSGEDGETIIDVDLGRIRTLDPAPTGDLIAVTNHRFELVVVDVAEGTAKTVHENQYRWIGGTDWSPDGRWLAYSASDSELTRSIRVYDTQRGRSQPVTAPGMFE